MNIFNNSTIINRKQMLFGRAAKLNCKYCANILYNLIKMQKKDTYYLNKKQISQIILVKLNKLVVNIRKI